MVLRSRGAIGLFSCLTLLLGGTALGAPAAHAESTCQKKTGGGSSSLGYTGKNSGNSSNGYTCAFHDGTGKKKIGAWATKSVTYNTPKGYVKRTDCHQGSKYVSFTPAYAETSAGSSYTMTMTNWDVDKHHYGVGVLWNTDDVNSSQFSTSSCGYGDFAYNLFWQSYLDLAVTGTTSAGVPVEFTVTATADGNNPVEGSVGVYWQKGEAPDPQVKDGEGTVVSGTDPLVGGGALSDGAAIVQAATGLPVGDYKFYAAFAGTSYTLAPPQRGWLGALSSTIGLTISAAAAQDDSDSAAVSQVRSAARQTDSGTITVVRSSAKLRDGVRSRCPKDQRPIQADVSAGTAALGDESLKWGGRRVAVRADAVKGRTRVALEIVCRSLKAQMWLQGGTGFGTVQDDMMRLDRKGTLLAGPGADRLLLTGVRAVAFGSLGGDRVVVRARRAVADGGPGRDLIRSLTKNPKSSNGVRGGAAMLIGGPGWDRIVGGLGPDRINAVDGQRDMVRCRGHQNRVIADPEDRIVGDCRTTITAGAR